jgi:hypothetical protein
MKALSIRQPWAELILQGRKQIELRTWNTNYRGQIVIHAGQQVKEEHCRAYGFNPEELVRGALVGTVEIVDVIAFDEESYNAHAAEHLRLGKWPGDLVGWRLANPVRFETPIPMSGKQGLFDVDDNLIGTPSPYLSHRERVKESIASGALPDPARPFELVVEPLDERSYALALYQWPVKANGVLPEPKRVVSLSGDSLRAVADHVLEALRRSGYKVTDLSPRRREPFWMEEEAGVRLGLLFLAVAPLSRMDRVEAISRELRMMPSEEAYYWYSKCTAPDVGSRAQRALRVLLAAE